MIDAYNKGQNINTQFTRRFEEKVLKNSEKTHYTKDLVYNATDNLSNENKYIDCIALKKTATVTTSFGITLTDLKSMFKNISASYNP